MTVGKWYSTDPEPGTPVFPEWADPAMSDKIVHFVGRPRGASPLPQSVWHLDTRQRLASILHEGLLRGFQVYRSGTVPVVSLSNLSATELEGAFARGLNTRGGSSPGQSSCHEYRCGSPDSDPSCMPTPTGHTVTGMLSRRSTALVGPRWSSRLRCAQVSPVPIGPPNVNGGTAFRLGPKVPRSMSATTSVPSSSVSLAGYRTLRRRRKGRLWNGGFDSPSNAGSFTTGA